MEGQLLRKAHINFRRFAAVFGVACKLPRAVTNLKFHNNLQCRKSDENPTFHAVCAMTHHSNE